MEIFREGLDENILGDAPSEAFVDIMQMKGKAPNEPIEHIIAKAISQSCPANVKRRAGRNQKLSPGSEATLRTEALLRIFEDARFQWHFTIAGTREAILRSPAGRVEDFYIPQLKADLARPDLGPKESVQYSFLLEVAHFRLTSSIEPESAEKVSLPQYKTKKDPEKMLSHLEAAMAANRGHQKAVVRAGSSVPPLFGSMASTNAVAYEWQFLCLTNPRAPKDVLIDLCSRGKAACDKAAAEFRFWTKIRRDAIEYTALLHFLLQIDANSQLIWGEGDDRREHINLNSELIAFVELFKNSLVKDVLLMLRPNMEPAAQKMIKASTVYQHLNNLAKHARISRKLIADLKTQHMGNAQ